MVCEYYDTCEGRKGVEPYRQETMCKGPAHPPIHHPFSDEENRCVPVLCPIWEQKKTLEEKANPEKKDVLTTKELGLEEKAD